MCIRDSDDDIDLRCKSYLTVGTLESYTKIRDYFGSDKVLPIYVEVELSLIHILQGLRMVWCACLSTSERRTR